jgi:cell wall-associated NlpC family hydrolase
MNRFKFLIALLIFLLSCQISDRDTLQHRLNRVITDIQHSFIPDNRLDIFDAQAHFENGVWLITGETTVAEAKAAFIKAADSILANKKYKAEIILLPPPSLGDSVHALVRVSVANVRKSPKHSAEMVDQVIMGTPLRLLKREDHWYLMQTPYRYLGWMDSSSFVRHSPREMENWKSARHLRFEEIHGIIRAQPREAASPVADIVMGCIVQSLGKNGTWTHILLPDGRKGYLPTKSLANYSDDLNEIKPKREALVALTHRLIGIPYLWGGNSSKGFDCSGFTQTVFKMHGLLLARDASQQVKQGIEIVPNEKFSNLLPGDLLFFGKEDRITHVAISLGGPRFIHANAISGDVHINSLSKDDADYSELRQRTLKQIRRVIN